MNLNGGIERTRGQQGSVFKSQLPKSLEPCRLLGGAVLVNGSELNLIRLRNEPTLQVKLEQCAD
jgi:hypothetical protein